MSVHVRLKGTKGGLAGVEFVFEHPLTCFVGRGAECEFRIPDDLAHRNVSRRHCILTLDVSGVRVRDCGSRNGTYVNGIKIGQRRPDQEPEEFRPETMEDFPLEEGDELRVGDEVFHVGLGLPVACGRCGKDLAWAGTLCVESEEGDHLCDWCRQEAQGAEDRPAVYSI